MGIQKTGTLPKRLEGLRRRFELWRGTHKGRSRIPEAIWGSAVKMAGAYGLHRTAKALRLDYYALKKRVEREGSGVADRPRKDVAAFVELTPHPFVGACECVMELESAAGAKMRVHLKGVASPDLVALGQSFWDSQP
jgi:hypothetical protein